MPKPRARSSPVFIYTTEGHMFHLYPLCFKLLEHFNLTFDPFGCVNQRSRQNKHLEKTILYILYCH